MDEFAEHFRAAKAAGLGVTLHIAEVRSSSLPLPSIGLTTYILTP